MAEEKIVQEQDLNQLRKVRREKLADLQANGKDPFVITKYSGLDPEIGMGGIDNSIYPRSMTTVLGINLQF